MKILIIGTGGIGAYYGYFLQQSGNDIVFTARGEHLAALEENGLTLIHEGTTYCTPVKAHTHGYLAQHFEANEFDLIILTLKAHSTDAFVKEMGSWLTSHPTFVLSLQNGVDNENILADLLGSQYVLGGLAVRIGSHVLSPGVIQSTGKAEIIIGAWPNDAEHSSPVPSPVPSIVSQFSDVLAQASIPNQVSTDIRRELWRKLMINNGVNPLSAITGLDTFALTNHERLGSLVYGMMQETVNAAKADGVELTQQDLSEMFELIKTFKPIKTSMLMDKEHGRKMELDSIIGVVLQRSETLGIQAPYNTMAFALLTSET